MVNVTSIELQKEYKEYKEYKKSKHENYISYSQYKKLRLRDFAKFGTSFNREEKAILGKRY